MYQYSNRAYADQGGGGGGPQGQEQQLPYKRNKFDPQHSPERGTVGIGYYGASRSATPADRGGVNSPRGPASPLSPPNDGLRGTDPSTSPAPASVSAASPPSRAGRGQYLDYPGSATSRLARRDAGAPQRRQSSMDGRSDSMDYLSAEMDLSPAAREFGESEGRPSLHGGPPAYRTPAEDSLQSRRGYPSRTVSPREELDRSADSQASRADLGPARGRGAGDDLTYRGRWERQRGGREDPASPGVPPRGPSSVTAAAGLREAASRSALGDGGGGGGGHSTPRVTSPRDEYFSSAFYTPTGVGGGGGADPQPQTPQVDPVLGLHTGASGRGADTYYNQSSTTGTPQQDSTAGGGGRGGPGEGPLQTGSLRRDPVTHRLIPLNQQNGVVRSPTKERDFLNQSQHSLTLSRLSLNKSLPRGPTLYGREYGVHNSLVNMALLALLSLIMCVLATQLLFRVTSRATPGIPDPDTVLMSNRSYLDVGEVVVSLASVAVLLDLCCLLTCSLQGYFAAKLLKLTQGEERAFKYLKECMPTRCIAMVGFFLSVPVFMFGLMLYVIMEYRSTPAIAAVVILTVAISFSISMATHSTWVWHTEKAKADHNLPPTVISTAGGTAAASGDSNDRQRALSQSELSTLV